MSSVAPLNIMATSSEHCLLKRTPKTTGRLASRTSNIYLFRKHLLEFCFGKDF